MQGHHVLIHGPGGTGKSYNIISLVNKLSTYKRVCCTATTGIAALNLVGTKASTLHRWAGIGLGDKPYEFYVNKIKYNPEARKQWMTTEVLIIDECSMLGASLFDKLDLIGRNIRDSKEPFGGITLVLCADFLQLPPVRDKWVFLSSVWSELKENMMVEILDQPKRYPDILWFQLLKRIRNGETYESDINFLYSRKKAYDEYLINKEKNKGSLDIQPTILYSRKDDVEAENEMELNKLPGVPVSYHSVDIFTPLSRYSSKEYYEKLLDETIPKVLTLKVGAQVMLRANLDIEGGLANGSRGVVIHLTQDSATIKWKNNRETVITPYAWSKEDKDGKFTRSQMPLTLAWSNTIHKSQGLTLDYAICNLGFSVFSPGQSYVSLSRVRVSDGLLLSDFNEKSIMVDKDAFEFVNNLEKDRETLSKKLVMVFHK